MAGLRCWRCGGGCEIEISGGEGGREKREKEREGEGGGERCSISGCSDKTESGGTSWEFCASDACVFFGVVLRCVALWSAPEEKANDG